MAAATEAFKRTNGSYPAQIIFYRDGVGEGQVEWQSEGVVHDSLIGLSG
jgi:hypothetical protein